MAVKIEKTGNYLVVTDVTTGNVLVDRPTKDVWYQNTTSEVRLFESQYNNELGIFPLNATYATGSVELTGGASGSVSGITVDGVQVMSGSEAFDTDLDTTATNIAANITAHTSVPNYTATATGSVITITAAYNGTSGNGLAVVTTAVTITKTDTNTSGATTGIVDTSDVPYADMAAMVTFLRANTGA